MRFAKLFTLASLAIISSNALKDIKIDWNMGNNVECINSDGKQGSKSCWSNAKATPDLYKKMVTLDQVVEPTGEPSEEPVDYFSCAKNDLNCKSAMLDLCYSEVTNCWISGKRADICNKKSSQCAKIWKN